MPCISSHTLLNLALAAAVVAPLGVEAQIRKPGTNPPTGQITVGSDLHHDLSQPLRSVSVFQPGPIRRVRGVLPGAQGGSPTGPLSELPSFNGFGVPRNSERAAPSLVNGGVGAATALTVFNLAGVGNFFSGPNGSFTPSTSPSDATGAVGTTQYLQFVDDSFAVFSKATGDIEIGPIPGNALWAGFGGPCEIDSDGQPTVNFDKIAHRWVVSQHSISGGSPYLECLAVSTTDDATGTWNRYSFNLGYVSPSYVPRNAKLGVWPDGYYMTIELYSGSTYVGPRICALQRASMLTGAAAGIQCTLLDSIYGGPAVVDMDGSLTPPAGAPAYFAIDDPGYYAINLFKFHVDWSDAQNSTLSLPVLLNQVSFNPTCGSYSYSTVCVPQPNGIALNVSGNHLVGRLVYRNYGDHQSLFAAEAVETPSNIRFYEIRIASNGDVSMYQQGNLQTGSAAYRFLPSIAADRAGNIATAYNVSSPQMAVSQYVASRTPSDTPGELGNETLLNPGQGSQTTSEWDSRSALTIDPIDDCTFYYTEQYQPMDGTNNWSTQIEAFQLAGCYVPVTLQTVPAGLKVIATGIGSSATQAAPYTASFPDGSTLAIGTVSPQNGLSGVRYVFSNWSDGGTLSHYIKTPAAPTTFTANFTTQYNLSLASSPSAGGTITASQTGFLNSGTIVNLTATPAAGYAFTGWTGNVATPSSAVTTVTMNAPQAIRATFAPLPTTVTAALSSQTGSASARLWSFTLTDNGPGVANGVAISTFSLTQTAGTACKPTLVTKLPLAAGSAAVGGKLTAAITVNTSSCAANAVFSLSMAISENGGASTSTATFSGLMP